METTFIILKKGNFLENTDLIYSYLLNFEEGKLLLISIPRTKVKTKTTKHVRLMQFYVQTLEDGIATINMKHSYRITFLTRKNDLHWYLFISKMSEKIPTYDANQLFESKYQYRIPKLFYATVSENKRIKFLYIM